MQEKGRVKEALDEEQRRVYELENRLTRQKEVGSSGAVSCSPDRPEGRGSALRATDVVGGGGSSPRVSCPQGAQLLWGEAWRL